MNKIKKAIASFSVKRMNGNKDMPEISLRVSQEKGTEKSGADKIDKAILFFKQRRAGVNDAPEISLDHVHERGPEGTSLDTDEGMPDMPVQDSPEEKEKEKAGWTPPEDYQPRTVREISSEDRPENASDERSIKTEERAPDFSVQDSPEEKEKEKAGWISPKYSQSRTARLDPGFISENRCLAYADDVMETEAYRVLRSQLLQRTRGSNCNTIMVTSALPGEGKTLTAINLAFSLAREFQHTVLLVDGDLRKQSIHKYLGCDGEKGLIDYLLDGSPVSDLITWPGIEKLTLISGGRSYQESAEVLGSPRMKELVSEMKKRYPERYIIFDIPPILTAADAHTFAPLVDQVVVVVQAGKTPIDDVKKAARFLPKEKLLGFVLNRC